MSSSSKVLITGANRGIGKGLVKAYLANPNTTVIATVRNPSTAQSLESLPKASGSSLIVIKVEFASTEGIKSGIASLASEHGIKSLDVVIANAGFAGLSPKVSESSASDIQPFVDINTYGQIELYKAVAPLLRESKSSSKGKFIYVSSAGGSIANMNIIVSLSAYGTSKAMGNFLFRWLSFETDDILIWMQHPGMVETEMAKTGFSELKAKGIDLSAHLIAPDQSGQAIKKVVDDATWESRHGKFIGHKGEEIPW